MVVRGCGASRIAGGVYVMVPTSPLGLPLESFLIDPPRAFSREELAVMGVSAQGMSFIPGNPGEPLSLVDWVGGDNYPNTFDILAEIRVHGLSRRVQSTINFTLLGPGSRIYLLHDRAHINYRSREELWAEKFHAGEPSLCPQNIPDHRDWWTGPHEKSPMCAQLWKECVEGGEPLGEQSALREFMHLGDRGVLRTIGDVHYAAKRPPDGVPLSYTPAIFASFPIAKLDVVRDPIGGRHVKALDKARKAGLPVEEVDE